MKRLDFLKRAGAGSIGLILLPQVYSCATNKNKAEAAWAGIRSGDGPVFAYVHPKKGVPNVLLYGDSISIGYTTTVRAELEGKASVYRIYNNGMSSNILITKMEKLEKTMFKPYLKGGWGFEWDVIHFNVGLHDIKYMGSKGLDKENGKIVSSVATYKENLKNICDYLQEKFPKAKLVFATTTPVPENAKGRFAGDAKKYNTAAREVLKNYPSISINDLYDYTLPHHEEWMEEPGNVHYNKLGRTAQGKRVAQVILEQLDQ
ncbi:SGNH/GDSL hydrolase family protein [Zobellia alginiliquefaciens]|uniref:SGNH/GDSL hydrolase family protein n=1 Tax=Zobellia alginiliquefaciens TaxID=3032586 RepID=UPI0023E3B401|nr:SGNH/GDSL hydrolase family protein [Zobellia alginiliquefaciens]